MSYLLSDTLKSPKGTFPTTPSKKLSGKLVSSNPVSYTHLCLSEAGLIRLLIRGYEPKEKPDDRFYDVMRELSSIGNNINQLAAKANTLGFIDASSSTNTPTGCGYG